MRFSFRLKQKISVGKSSFVVLIIKLGEKVENKTEIFLQPLTESISPTLDL